MATVLWTDQEVNLLADMSERGCKSEDIAIAISALGTPRSRSAVMNKIAACGAPRAGTLVKKSPPAYCGFVFFSIPALFSAVDNGHFGGRA